MSFIFGGDTGLSYDQIQRKRQLADAMAGSIGTPRNVGEGLSAIGKALASRGMNRQAEKADQQNREKFDGNWAKIFNGGFTGQAPSYVPIPEKSENQSIADGAMTAIGKRPDFGALEERHGLPSGYLDRTYMIESSGNPNAQNPNSSAGGGFQFIDSTAQAYGLTDKTDLNASADAAARLAADNRRQLKSVLGREPTAAELYLAHQQGGGGASKLLSNPNARAVDIVGRDAVTLNGGAENMTAGEFANKWLGKYGGQQPGRAAGGGQGMSIEALAEAAGSPYASAGQKAVAQALLQQQMRAMDPAYTLGIEQQRLELDQMRNPEPEKTAGMREYEFAKSQGFEGSFTDFKMSMRKAGATNVTVGGQGEVGTIPQGYELFTDPESGARSLQPIAGGPEDTTKEAEATIAQADETIRLIDQVLTDPALPSVVGRVQGRLEPKGVGGALFMGQDALNLMPKIEQLQGKAFLQAFEGLKGGGQITEREGQAATAAITRLNQRYVDEATYIEALNDLKRIADNAKKRARGETVEEYIPGWLDEPSGEVPSYNPETGKWE